MKSKYPNVEGCNPRGCIASRIMKTHRIINTIFRKHLKGFDLTNSQMSILFLLSKKGASTQGALAETLYLEKSTISRNMKRLYEKEYVSKAAFPSINITDKGLALMNEMIPFWDKAMHEAQTKLGKEGIQALDILLTKLTN